MNFSLKSIILIIGIAISQSIAAYSQCSGDNTFNGALSNDWNIAGNWSAGCVPTSPISGNINISANCTFSGSVSYIFNSSSSFNIETGATFTFNGTGNWAFLGLVVGEGTFSDDMVLDGSIKPGPEIPVWTCGDALEYGGQSYATVKIGTQCWMAENLNIGTKINSNSVSDNQTDNNIVEKYCYDNDESNCDTYGGLYQWNEMMQYVTTESTQGVCPTGWHIPSDDEIKTLEMELGMTQAQADASSFRGTNQGSQLAGNAALWNYGVLEEDPGFDFSGFDALPGGNRLTSGSFGNQGGDAILWSSTAGGPTAWRRLLVHNNQQVRRDESSKSHGYSVRCVQN